MCKNTQHLKLCTCKDVVDTATDKQNMQATQSLAPDNIIWTLEHYLGKIMSLAMGMPARPTAQLNETMTQSYVLAQLNTHNCFDFDYIPTQGDNLTLQNQYGFMSFIYRDNTWTAGTYDPFLSNLRKIANGAANCED